jgi:hypothetical protein
MIILHHQENAQSRTLCAEVLGREISYVDFNEDGVLSEGGHTIYHWDFGGREAWYAIGGTNKVSALPSVVVDVPAYLADRVDLEQNVVGTIQIDAEQVALRAVGAKAYVQAFLKTTNSILAKSKTLGLTPSPAKLTLANLNQADTGRG